MKSSRTSSRGPPVRPEPTGKVELPSPSFVDEEGYRYHTVTAGARIIGDDILSRAALWRYAMAGIGPAGLDLCVFHQPLLRTGHQKPRSDWQTRPLIREDRLLALGELLRDHRRNRGGRMSEEDLSLMRDSARRFRLPRRRPDPS
jgi:hypothetical protein